MCHIFSAIRCSHLVQLLATAIDHEHHMIYLVYENIGITTLDNLINSHGNRNITWEERIHLVGVTHHVIHSNILLWAGHCQHIYLMLFCVY